MANCVQNNLCKFCKKILNYTENNDICLRGSFLLSHTVELPLHFPAGIVPCRTFPCLDFTLLALPRDEENSV